MDYNIIIVPCPKLTLAKKKQRKYLSERAFQVEQNGPNFSLIAPSIEEL